MLRRLFFFFGVSTVCTLSCIVPLFHVVDVWLVCSSLSIHPLLGAVGAEHDIRRLTDGAHPEVRPAFRVPCFDDTATLGRASEVCTRVQHLMKNCVPNGLHRAPACDREARPLLERSILCCCDISALKWGGRRPVPALNKGQKSTDGHTSVKSQAAHISPNGSNASRAAWHFDRGNTMCMGRATAPHQ